MDFVVSCLDVPGNIDMSRLLQQNGLVGVKQLWLDGYDQTTLRQYASLMQNTYFLVAARPVPGRVAVPRDLPRPGELHHEMNRYEPQYTLNEVAMDGWLSAALFVAGLRGRRAQTSPSRSSSPRSTTSTPSPPTG